NYEATAPAIIVTPTTNAVITASKTVSDLNGGDALAGETLEYSVVLKNTGADPAFNVVFTDPIPANTTYVADSSTPVGTFDGEVLNFNVGTLASNAEVTIKFQVSIDADVPIGTMITNQGVVDSDQTVPTPTNRADIRVGGDLTAGTLYAQKMVAKVGGTGPAIGNGDTVKYSLTLQNTGSATLTDARLTDTLPAGLTYVTASASAEAGTITVANGVVTWAAGDLDANASVTATFQAKLADDAVPSNSRRDFTNQATVTYTDPANRPQVTTTDSNGTASDGNQPTVFTAVSGTPPLLDVRKLWELTVDQDANGLPSANDTLRYTLILTNTGTEPAANVRLTDTIPANTSVVAGSVTTSQGAVTGSSPVAVNLGNLAAGQTATVSFQVVINSDVATGTVIQNQADVSATGLTASSNTTLTTVINGSQFPTPIAKQVVAHSESVTDASRALIGEVLTYRLTISIPPGETRQVQFLDTLPSGLSYLDGSAKLARSADSLGSSLNPGGINVKTGYGSEITDDAFVDVSDVVASDDQTLILALGNVTNANALSSASYVLQYQVLVLNTSGNVRGTDLSNAGTVSYWNALSVEQTATPMQATVKIQEPELTLGMTAGPSSLLSSGGTTTYTLTVTNNGDAPAYNVRVADALPAVFTSASTTTGGCAIAGLNLTCDIAEIAPGASVTLSFNATAGTIPGSQITNSATATWTSLPGASGTDSATPGTAGNLDGERTGGTGTGSNGYTTSASATIVVGLPSLTKTIENPQAHYAIGEIVNYRVTVSLPAGMNLSGAQIIDTLPVGLSYVAGSASEAVSVSGPTLTFALGTLNTTTRTLTYQARVDNVLSNQNNTALTNGAQLRYTNPGTGAATQTAVQSQTVLVGEPYLALTLNVTPTAGLQAGDTVTYSLTLSNSGSATTAAHNVSLDDLLPAGLSGVPGTLTVSGVGGVGASAFILDATGLTTSTPFTLPVGSTLSLSFDARLTSDVTPGESLLNQVVVDFASLAGDTTQARTGSDGSNQDDPNTLNNYQLETQAPVLTVGDTVALDKRFHPDTTLTRYAVGAPVTYRLTLSLIEGRTDSVIVTDTLPAGLRYTGATIGSGSLGLTHQFNDSGHGLTTTTDAQGRTILDFDLGTVINPADGRRDNDYLTIDISAQVANVAVTNPADATLSNAVQTSYRDGTGQTQTVIFDADPQTSGIQPLDLTVIEPALILEKMADSSAPLALNDEVTYSLTLRHLPTSAANAYDLTVTDTLPAGLSYIAQTGDPAPEVDGQTLTFSVSALTLTQGQTTLTYRARVNNLALAGQSLVNQAQLSWASQPDATGASDSGRTGDGETNGEGGENDYLSAASTTVSVVAQSVADVMTSVTAPVIASLGDRVEVGVTYTNLGPDTAEGVIYLLLLTPGLDGVTCGGGSVVCVYDPRDGRVTLTGLPDHLETGDLFSLQLSYSMPPQGPIDVWSEIATTTPEVADTNNKAQASTLTEDAEHGQLHLVKTAYLDHDAGAGCPGSKEISVVNKYRVPVDMTWCFSVTNIGENWLDNPVFIDAGLGIAPGNQAGLRLRSGRFPLAPGATAVWYYEENRDISLLNYVELTMTPVELNGSPIPNAEPAWGADSIPAIFGYVFDPPFGVKTGRVGGQDIVRWTMVWVNDNVIRADGVSITDPPPEGMTMASAPICTPYGETSVDFCGFDAPSADLPRGRVRVTANFGQDFGVTLGTIGQAPNRLEIAFDVLVDRPETEETYENQGEAEWTPPEAEGETFVSETYDLTQLEGLDPALPPSDIDPEDVPPTGSPVTPSARTDLSLTKTIDNAAPLVGGEVTFSLAVVNQGPDLATAVQVSDRLPNGYSYRSAIPSVGRYDATTCLWVIGSMDVGESVTLDLSAEVLAEGEYTNSATVSAREPDPNPDDNTDTVTPVPVEA
ncbi:isopeptide-forming domain-containing fimbrial protein, partial [Allochromatium palmeri]